MTGVLDELPSPRTAAYGINCGVNCSASSPHTASWGANVIAANGGYHMYVSQLTRDCPLTNWMTNMDVAHAVSDSPLGPFRQKDYGAHFLPSILKFPLIDVMKWSFLHNKCIKLIAIAPFSTNPEAIVDEKGDWWLFFLGDGLNNTQQVDCRHQDDRQQQAGDSAAARAPPPPAPPDMTGVVQHGPGRNFTSNLLLDCDSGACFDRLLWLQRTDRGPRSPRSTATIPRPLWQTSAAASTRPG